MLVWPLPSGIEVCKGVTNALYARICNAFGRKSRLCKGLGYVTKWLAHSMLAQFFFLNTRCFETAQ